MVQIHSASKLTAIHSLGVIAPCLVNEALVGFTWAAACLIHCCCAHGLYQSGQQDHKEPVFVGPVFGQVETR